MFCPLSRIGAHHHSRYGAVVRGANAYVPPGARRQQSGSDTPQAPLSAKGPDKDKDKDKENQKKPEAPVPNVSVNAPDGSEKVLPRGTTSPSVPAKVRIRLQTRREQSTNLRSCTAAACGCASCV